VIADGLDRVIVSYWFKSMEALGNGIDNVGMSEEYQAAVIKASELGTLLRSRILVMI
jgi:hypothetical protein